MKKLYSLATLFFLALLGMTASAKSYTFEVNNPSLVKLTVGYGSTQIEFNDGNSVTVDGFGVYYYDFYFEAVSGYAITNVMAQSVGGNEYQELGNPHKDWRGYYDYDDGTKFTVTVEQLQSTTFTLQVDDYTHLASVGSLDSFNSNEFEVSFTPLDQYVVVGCATTANGKYFVKSVEYANGDTDEPDEPDDQYYTIYTYKINEGDVVKLTTEFMEMPYYTIQVTDIAHIKEINGQPTATYNPVDNSFSLATEDTYFSIVPAEGYQITSIKCDNKDLFLYTTPPLKSYSTVYLYFPDTDREPLEVGSTITIETERAEYPKWTFHGANGIRFKYNDNVVVSDQDVFEYQFIGQSGNLYISCVDVNRRIKSVQKVGSSYTETVRDGVAEIYFYDPEAAEYNIETVEYSKGTIKVTVDNPSKVEMYVGESYYPATLEEGENEIEFGSDNPTIMIKHSEYYNGEKVYAVTVNGQALTRNSDYYGTFSFEVTQDDEVEIFVDFPKINVPVSFSFGDEDVTKIITSVKFGYYDEIENWADDDFCVALGKTINIFFDDDTYQNITLTANGRPVEVDNYGTASYTFDSEESVEFVVTAELTPVNVITINCDQWEHLDVYRNFDNMSYELYENPVEITGPTTVIEVPQSRSHIYVRAKDNYYIAEATDLTSPAVSHAVAVEDGKVVDLVLEKLVRENPLIIFVENDDANENTFSQENTSFRGLFDVYHNKYNEDAPIVVGYNEIKVADDDALSFYPYGVVYINGELQNEYVTLDPIPANTVIKVFSAEPQEWSMNYSFGEGVDVEVYHDHITKIESPATHAVFHGTHVAIKPVETTSPVAAAPAVKFEVKLNGETLTPNEDGFYEFTADRDVEVSVNKTVTTGLEAILIDGQDADIYNLQGIKVGNTAHTKNLAPGIYIINGIKIRF